jgi:hypothetical protein
MEQSSNLNSLEIRHGWKNYYLFGFFSWIAIILIGFIIPSLRGKTNTFFFGDLTISKILVFAIILSIPTVCLYNYFDKQVKLKIDNLGVWTKKNGIIQWQDLQYFRTTEIYAKEGDIYNLIFKQKENMQFVEKEIKIELRRMDKDFNEIRREISSYLTAYKIEDLGHKKSDI